jgi:hypothetical protein
MKKCILLIKCLILVLLSCNNSSPTQHTSNWLEASDYLHQFEAEIIDSSGYVIHQLWEIPNDPALWQKDFPAFPSFQQYEQSLIDHFGQAKLDSVRLARSQKTGAYGTSGDQNNAQLVLDGKAGAIRPINCLEAHLLNFQLQRFPLFDHPTEFGAFILKKDSLLRIYYSASDQPWPPKDHIIQPKIDQDIQNGWKLFGHLHNHYNSAEEDYLGVLAPSMADAHYFKGKKEGFGLEKAFITNVFHTVEIDSSDFHLFSAHQ